MLGRPGCIGPAPDKIYIIFPQHLSSVRHKKNFRSWGLGSRLSVGSRVQTIGLEIGAQCSAKIRFLVVCNISPLFFVSRYPFQPRMDWSRPRRASSEPPVWFECKGEKLWRNKKTETRNYPQTPHVWSRTCKGTLHHLGVDLIDFFSQIFLATSGAMNSRVPTIELI